MAESPSLSAIKNGRRLAPFFYVCEIGFEPEQRVRLRAIGPSDAAGGPERSEWVKELLEVAAEEEFLGCELHAL